MSKELEGRTALVTGGARGIGRATCVLLARAGAKVAINYASNEAAAHEALGLVEAEGARGMIVQGDVSEPDAVAAMVAVHRLFADGSYRGPLVRKAVVADLVVTVLRRAGVRLTPAALATLVIGVLAIVGTTEAATEGLGTGLNPLLIGILVWAIGLSLGGPTGYAINPARDLGPRLVHAALPIPDKGGSDWQYSWVPVVGPIIGGILGAWIWVIMPFG